MKKLYIIEYYYGDEFNFDWVWDFTEEDAKESMYEILDIRDEYRDDLEINRVFHVKDAILLTEINADQFNKVNLKNV